MALMTLKFFDKLSQNFIELLGDKDDYNVIITVKNEKSFTAHSNVLKCRSPYFCRELKNIIPNANNIKTVTKPNISDEIFDIILKYIYGGIVDLKNKKTKFIFDLMIAADEFEIKELTQKLENNLIETKSSWLKSHFSLVYRSIFSGNNFKDLEKFCNGIVTKYPNLIFDAEDFTSLQESALVSLLKRDDLQLEEVIIWEYIIKWGVGQNSTLPEDLKEWTNENFTTLKTTLQQCLPLIRYFHIPGTDVFKKIKPYKKILNKQLWDDLKKHFMAPDQLLESIILPPRTTFVLELPTRITKSIISREHEAEISSWIDRKSSIYSLANTPYDFHLILRGSKDGFVPQTFWNTCHESALVSLLKRDDLQLEEVIIWEYIIKWGVGQNSTLPEDLKEWTNENFTTLKTTLQQCLPLIRYFHIPGTDVFKKIKPYKKILNKQLWDDLKKHFMAPDQLLESIILPPRTTFVLELPTRITKSIISREHEAEISSWIDRKSSIYSLANTPYDFHLILRGSKDGFVPQTFWNTCHVKETDEILGGFNPLAWNNTNAINSSWGKTNDSFIFSLKNGNIQNSFLSRVKTRDNAIWNPCKAHQVTYGPCFGNNLYMYSSSSNFTLDNNSACNRSYNNYEKPIRTTSNGFSIVDYEVFKIIKKTS
ncbi:hypothetical protein Glove_199g138 [Diversispora epigaea]|uniref:BTB domain-containing protein n=1 Tax=Diversispora epigaea TaxID=1348612 RepID=A0A397IT68_9GLOM|nr:hypothetical protein Glove_199g138 [Diversispora epigaea]